MPTGPRPSPPTRSVKVVFTGSLQSAVWQNVMWGFATGSAEIPHSSAQSLSQDLFAAYGNYFLPFLSNSCFLNSCQVVVYGPEDEFVEGFESGATPGGVNDQPAPANVALCISWKVRTSFRGGHSRTYLCGVPVNAELDARLWGDSVRAAAADAAQSFHNEFEGLTYTGIESLEHGMMSFVHDKEWRVPPHFFRIYSWAVDGRIDTQRRRLGRDLPA